MVESTIGKIVVISAPSGTGKSSIIGGVRKVFPDIYFSVSYTTRPMRDGEVDGIHYHFTKQENFIYLANRWEFIEWANVHGEFYGTSRQLVMNELKQGRNVLLDIDINGFKQVSKFDFGLFCPEIVSIFILPPSVKCLEDRLLERPGGTNNLKKRLENAREEIGQAGLYDHFVVNKTGLLHGAINDVVEIIGE